MSPGSPESSEAEVLLRQLRLRIVRGTTVLSLPISLSLAIYYAIWGPLRRGGSLTAAASNVVELLLFTGVLYLLGGWRVDRLLHGRCNWLFEARTPNSAERCVLARLPLRFAGELFSAMAVVALGVGVGSAVGSRTWQDPVRAVVGLSLAGSIFAALTYLVSEHGMRPLFARALGEPTTPSPIGVERRLLIGWALGSGIPLLFVLAIPLRGGPGHRLPVTVPLLFMASTGLVIGIITTMSVARSVATPLRSLRMGLTRVEAGDFDATVLTDDPGDLGELQRGFNQMVAGLRQRRALEDLFGRYVGRDLATQVVASGPNLGGEVRLVTVMFVDLIGSTAMAEKSAPTEVVTTMNAFYRAVAAVTDRHGGWIDKFEGDGAMCVFGAPLAQSDQADRALAAAVDLHAALSAVPLSAAIGVAAGAAVAGTVGTSDRFEYTVIGRPVNEAARLTDEAKTRQPCVIASASVVDLACTDTQSAWHAAGDVQLKGIDRPIQIYQPISATSSPRHPVVE